MSQVNNYQDYYKRVVVVGACGHVGFPLSLVIANSPYLVYGLDVDETRCKMYNQGRILYKEEGASELLQRCLQQNKIEFGTDVSKIKASRVVIVIIGTPLDNEGNASVKDLMTFVDNSLIPNIQKGQLIILRSTVTPGTTELVRDKIEKATGLKESKDFFLVYAPERVSQGNSIIETKELPQIIGAFPWAYDPNIFNPSGFSIADDFFFAFTKKTIQLTPREAEFAKLMTNMYRYVNFALANEFYMLGEPHGIDVDRIIDAANEDYPRMNMPKPGFAAGPCLYKDGKFLLASVPYTDMIHASFLINEGLPQFVFDSILELNPDIKRVAILGMTFKAESDDIRNSLSFKFKKICKKHGVEVACYDPYWNLKGEDNYWTDYDHAWERYDAIVLMTPHKIFSSVLDNAIIKSAKQGCVIADIWKFWNKSKYSNTGIYKI